MKGFKQTDKQKAAATKALSKTWEIIWPDGKLEIIENMGKFCRENSLSNSNMSSVASGSLKQHKGFKCKRL
jgi:hypothetical protein